MLRPTLCLLAALSLMAPAAYAQDEEDFFSEFHFKDLRFRFWPSGVENRAKNDGTGSAITVHVDRVVIDGVNAQELRHCIDGDPSFCSYSLPGGDKDGTVTAEEVYTFENLSRAGLKGAVPRVNMMAKMLEDNLTVDGQHGRRDADPKRSATITRVQFVGAEGKTSSDAQILAYIDAKVSYDNDPKAKSHSIRIDDLSLRDEFFIYENAIWTTSAEGWGFESQATKPEAAKSLVNGQGYFSSQDKFESLSKTGIELQVKQGAGGKKSPGLEPALLLVGIVALALALRRK